MRKVSFESIFLLDGLTGTYADEADFQKGFLKAIRKVRSNCVFFEIETEETCAGFPDILCITDSNKAFLVELKFVRADGKVHFQPKQPLFYRKYGNSGACLNISIFAWDSRVNTCYVVDPDKIVRGKKVIFDLDKVVIKRLD